MDKKKFSILFIICMANSLIYTLPYLQSTYYDSMQAAYGFTHVQMGNLVSAYGIFNIFANFFGGVAMEKFAPVTAYRVIFTALVGCCIMGMMVSVSLHRYAKRKRM